ncbi:MAG: glycerophosphodiester phosphodiesterase [Alphaproteobacteria bacterium]|nr:glycerophosphodiester phosphodiesterase [Alphaproteobacteria bacterium]
MIIAHRGASGYLPEHTIEAYELALDQGADAIEPDLVLTKDGVLVARHDRYLSTTTDVADREEFADRKRADPNSGGEGRVDWWIEDFTLDEVKTLRARQPRKGRPTDQDGQFAIPTLAEVLVLATVWAQEEGRPIAIYPETKHPEFFASIGLDFENPLLISLEGYDAGLVFVQSFEPSILKRLHDQSTSALVFLTDDPNAVTATALDGISQFADGIGVEKSLVYDDSGCPTGLVAAAHQRGLFVHAWTFRNDETVELQSSTDPACFRADGEPVAIELTTAFRAGVDGVFADFPDTAIAIRDEMGQ